MADVAPSPVYRPAPARPRRTREKPRVSYRPRPRRPVPVAAAGRTAGSVAGFFGRAIPWIGLILGNVLAQSELAAWSERTTLDDYEQRKYFKQYKSGPRSRKYKREQPLSVSNPVYSPSPAQAVRPADSPRQPGIVPRPAPLPDPVMQPVALPGPVAAPVPQTPTAARPAPRPTPKPAPSPLALPFTFPLELPQLKPFAQPTGNPVLTRFAQPGVLSLPTPIPIPLQELDRRRRCDCKPTKAKPGKGYFEVTKAGTESRKYWKDDRRKKASNVIQFPKRG